MLELYQRIEKVLVDQGDRSEERAQQIQTAYECVLAVAQRDGKGFTPEPFRSCSETNFRMAGECTDFVSRL